MAISLPSGIAPYFKMLSLNHTYVFILLLKTLPLTGTARRIKSKITDKVYKVLGDPSCLFQPPFSLCPVFKYILCYPKLMRILSSTLNPPFAWLTATYTKGSAWSLPPSGALRGPGPSSDHGSCWYASMAPCTLLPTTYHISSYLLSVPI